MADLTFEAALAGNVVTAAIAFSDSFAEFEDDPAYVDGELWNALWEACDLYKKHHARAADALRAELGKQGS